MPFSLLERIRGDKPGKWFELNHIPYNVVDFMVVDLDGLREGETATEQQICYRGQESFT